LKEGERKRVKREKDQCPLQEREGVKPEGILRSAQRNQGTEGGAGANGSRKISPTRGRKGKDRARVTNFKQSRKNREEEC